MTTKHTVATARASDGEGRLRVLVVGAGIVGLAHAWSAAKRGHQVTVLEQDAQPCGASVRNFGMIWPIGQPPGEAHQIASISREAWLTLAREAGVWVRACGSVHLAHRQDEWAVLEEFHAAAARLGYECELFGRDETLSRAPAANPAGLLGGLFSPTELCVNPRTALVRTAKWLHERHAVNFEFSTHVRGVEEGRAHTALGSSIAADRIIVCGGDETRTLFPRVVRGSGLKRCKLQMFKTAPQPQGWSIGPHLAGGLTLRHYRNFSVCPSLRSLIDRIARETPELDRFGIHVMASQNDAGEVILGDSHEYDQDIEPFDKTIIDELMLRELRQIIRLPNWEVAERWHGTYLKHPEQPILEANPIPGVYVSTATGGAGMTMSFGLAERFWGKLGAAGTAPTETAAEAMP